MELSKSSKANFKTLQDACKAGRLALLDCQDVQTGKSVPVIVALNVQGHEYEFVPLARLCVGNPYRAFRPPNPQGSYHAD